MDSDPTVNKMARLLEIGATMLADSCKTCGAPLFRYHGEVFCPSCSEFEISGMNRPAKQPENISKAPVAVSAGKPAVRSQEPAVREQKTSCANTAPATSASGFSGKRNASGECFEEYENVRADFVSGNAQDLRDLLLTKVASLAEDIQDEKDPRRIAEYFDLIEKGLALVEKMNNM